MFLMRLVKLRFDVKITSQRNNFSLFSPFFDTFSDFFGILTEINKLWQQITKPIVLEFSGISFENKKLFGQIKFSRQYDVIIKSRFAAIFVIFVICSYYWRF